MKLGIGNEKLFKMMTARMGMQMVSPTMWKLRLIGITAFVKTGSLVFLVAASMENGNVAALDIVVAPVIIAGKMFLKSVIAGILETLCAKYHHRQRYKSKKEIIIRHDFPLLCKKYVIWPSVNSFKMNPIKNSGNVGMKTCSMNIIVILCSCCTNFTKNLRFQKVLKIPPDIPKISAQELGNI